MKAPLLTITDVSAFLKVSDDKVRHLLKTGTLRGVRIDRQWRITERDLDAYVEVQRQAAHAPTVTAAVEAAFDADRELESEGPF